MKIEDVLKVVDHSAGLVDRVQLLAASDVLVGIPKDKNARSDGPIGNAALAYLHEFGSPARNIPARPFLYPGLKKAKPKIVETMAAGAKALLEGKGSVDAVLNKVGIVARNAVVEEISDPTPPFQPLKPATIRARLRKTAAGRRQLKKLSGSAALSSWAGSNIKPLIDTGQLRSAITYVVKKA